MNLQRVEIKLQTYSTTWCPRFRTYSFENPLSKSSYVAKVFQGRRGEHEQLDDSLDGTTTLLLLLRGLTLAGTVVVVAPLVGLDVVVVVFVAIFFAFATTVLFAILFLAVVVLLLAPAVVVLSSIEISSSNNNNNNNKTREQNGRRKSNVPRLVAPKFDLVFLSVWTLTEINESTSIKFQLTRVIGSG